LLRLKTQKLPNELNIRELHIDYLAWRLPISGRTRLEHCGSGKRLLEPGAHMLSIRPAFKVSNIACC